MNEQCESVRGWLPDFGAGRLDPDRGDWVEEHLASCEECAAEARLLAMLFRARPSPPTELAVGIKRALGGRGRPVSRPWWGLAAAAVAAIAIGIGVVSPGPEVGVEVPSSIVAHEGDGLWLGDDGMIAGAPALDALSDEALRELLEEISPGGAA